MSRRIAFLLFAAVVAVSTVIIGAQTPLTFEVVSIRPSGELLSRGGAGRGGFGEEGCSSVNHFELDPQRLVARNTTLITLIWFAYPEIRPFPGMDCHTVAKTILAGGPEWIRSEQIDLQALIAAGTPRYTFAQFRAGEAAQLQEMLRTLLKDRFKLVLRRQTKDMPVYLLTLAKGGPKFNGRPARIPGRQFMVQDADGNVVPGDEPEWSGIIIGRSIEARNASMSDLAEFIYWRKERPVLDRTGLTGKFDFYLETTTTRNERQRAAAEGLSVPTEDIGVRIEAIGLKLEESKAPVEYWVIERVERPSEN